MRNTFFHNQSLASLLNDSCGEIKCEGVLSLLYVEVKNALFVFEM